MYSHSSYKDHDHVPCLQVGHQSLLQTAVANLIRSCRLQRLGDYFTAREYSAYIILKTRPLCRNNKLNHLAYLFESFSRLNGIKVFR